MDADGVCAAGLFFVCGGSRRRQFRPALRHTRVPAPSRVPVCRASVLRYRVLNLINSFHIEQLAKERKTRHRRAASRNNDDYIASALHFMQENYHEKLLLKDIADAVGLYPAYLQKIFRENRSTSVIEYLIRYRMEKSCGLLLETDLPVEKISELVGVGDLKNFYVSFRKYFNCTPAQYRKEHKVN